MSSRRRSIIKFLPEARNSSAFSVEIYIKDFTREIICESLKYFLRSNILIKDFLQRFLAKQLKNIPYKFRINSDDPMIDFWPKAIFSLRFPPKISSLQATPKNTVSQNCYLLSVICNAKNSFWETVNCQTVTSGVNWHGPRNRNLSSCFKNPKPIFPFQKL